MASCTKSFEKSVFELASTMSNIHIKHEATCFKSQDFGLCLVLNWAVSFICSYHFNDFFL